MCLDEICPFTTLTVHFHVKQHFEKNLCVMSFVSRLCQYCDNRRCTSRGKTVVFWWKLMQMWRALPFIVIASHRFITYERRGTNVHSLLLWNSFWRIIARWRQHTSVYLHYTTGTFTQVDICVQLSNVPVKVSQNYTLFWVTEQTI